MSNLSSATPRPWQLGRWKDGVNLWAPTVCPAEHGASICRFSRYGAPEKDAADAALIIEAVNGWEDARKLAEAVLEITDGDLGKTIRATSKKRGIDGGLWERTHALAKRILGKE